MKTRLLAFLSALSLLAVMMGMTPARSQTAPRLWDYPTVVVEHSATNIDGNNDSNYPSAQEDSVLGKETITFEPHEWYTSQHDTQLYARVHAVYEYVSPEPAPAVGTVGNVA